MSSTKTVVDLFGSKPVETSIYHVHVMHHVQCSSLGEQGFTLEWPAIRCGARVESSSTSASVASISQPLVDLHPL